MSHGCGCNVKGRIREVKFNGRIRKVILCRCHVVRVEPRRTSYVMGIVLSHQLKKIDKAAPAHAPKLIDEYVSLSHKG